MNSSSWWTQGKDRVAQEVYAQVEAVNQQCRVLREDTRFHLDLCSNANTAGNDTYFRPWTLGFAQPKMRRNICQAAVDTAGSMIAQNRTAPMYTTSAGNFSLSRKAAARSRVLQAQFYDLRAYELAADVFYDGAQTGTGGVYGYVEIVNGKPRPRLERVLPNELLVDDSDGRYRKPRSIHRVRFVAEEELIGRHPDLEREIRSSGGPTDSDWLDFNMRNDPTVKRVRVVESWHLASGPTEDADGEPVKHDGRYVACTDKVVLEDRPYSLPRFPLPIYRYANRRVGFFGQGLAERVAPAQIRLNELMKVIKDCQDLCSNAIVLVEENSGVEWEDLSNLPGQQVTYRQTAPQVVTYSGTPPDLAAEAEAIVSQVWQQEGLAESTVSGDKPAGLSSGRAVRAADDVMSRRYIQATRQFEQFFLDLTILICDLNDECARIDPDYMVTGRGRIGRQSFLRSHKWSDLALPENDVSVTLFPMNALPTTPAGKFAAVDEYIQGGFMSKPQALDLMEFPDVDAWHALENADYDLVQYQIEQMLDGFPELPIPQQNLQLALTTVNNAYKMAYRMQAPDEILQLLDDYLEYGRQQAEKAAPPPAEEAPAALNPNAAAAAQMAAQTPAA